MVAPVGPGGLDAMRGQDLARVESDDGDLTLVDDGEDALTGVGGADPQVMQTAGPAQGDAAAPVDQIVAEPEVTGGAAPGRVCLRSGPVGLDRGHAADGPVWSLFVVDDPERIELGLQLREGARCGLLPEPALQGLVEALDLALGLRMAGCPFFCRMPR